MTKQYHCKLVIKPYFSKVIYQSQLPKYMYWSIILVSGKTKRFKFIMYGAYGRWHNFYEYRLEDIA